MTRSPLALLGALTVVAAACDAVPPIVLETRVVTDTDVEEGPYEVLAVVRDDNAVVSATLFWSAGGVAGRAAMSPIVEARRTTSVRFSAGIPGHPIGTLVGWGIEVCDDRGNCRTDPIAYPLDAYEFRVGKIPSRPTIDEVRPSEGPASGGTRIEVSGSDFRSGVVVRIDGEPALFTEWIRADLVAAITPPHAPDIVDVQVENPDEKSALLADGFRYFPSPELLGVDPPEGPSSGGTPVVLHGRNFFEGVRAFFDGVPCRHQVRASDEELRCDTPPGRPGFVDVELAHQELGFALLEGGFFYIAPPVVDAVFPDSGTDLGGTTLVIDGADFDEGATVLVDGVPCLDVDVVSPTRITCVTPPGEPGVVDVTVVNTDGQSAVFLGGFSYLGPPVIIQVVPASGPLAGGAEVRVQGAGFDLDTAVYFGGVRAEVLEVIDGLELVVILPPSALAGGPVPESGLAAVDVEVVNEDPEDGRSDLLPGGFTYFWPPEVFFVEPPSGPTAGGTTVLITGRFFREFEGGEFLVFFEDDLALLDVEILSSTVIRAVTPPGPEGLVDVTVANFETSSGTLPDGYEYIPPPEVERVDPPDGPTFGGERVRVIGDNFRAGATVTFGGAPCTDVQFISETELTCITPPGEEGFVDVVVENPDGQQGTGASAYEYLGVIVEPDHGLPVGFTRVRVLAAGMRPGVVIRFGGAVATDCQRISEREVICQTPPHALGDVEVSFSNPDGTGDAREAAFSYRRFVDRSAGRLVSTERNATHVLAGDIDGDGDPDVMVSNGSPSVAQPDDLFTNDGTGVFVRTQLGAHLETSNKVSVGDLNQDALPDLVIATSGPTPKGAVLLENDGAGSFTQLATPGPETADGAFDAQLVDVVGDARDDLFILYIGCNSGGPDETLEDCGDDIVPPVGPDTLHERSGGGGFTDRSSLVPHDQGLVHDHKFSPADVDGDGDTDLVVLADNSLGGGFGGTPNRHRILVNSVDEGLGFEEDATPFAGLVGELFDIETGDINGDGRPDAALPSCFPPSGSTELVFTNAAGTLVQSFNALPTTRSGCFFGVHLFDADDDGDLDLAFTGDIGSQLVVTLYVNRGNGTFVDASAHTPGFEGIFLRGSKLASADLDGDGDLDLALSASSVFGGEDGDVRLLLLE